MEIARTEGNNAGSALTLRDKRQAKLEALYEKHGNLKSKAIKVDYKIRVAETQINILEAEMGISKPFYK